MLQLRGRGEAEQKGWICILAALGTGTARATHPWWHWGRWHLWVLLGGCDTRLCPVRGDSCVPSEPAQPLLHHQNTNEPNLALFQPQVLPGEQRFVQDHGTAPGTRLHKKVLSPRSVCVGEGTQGFGGQRDLLQLGRFAHKPAVN